MQLNLSFTRPAFYVDNTVLAAQDIVSYSIQGTVTKPDGSVESANIIPGVIAGGLTDTSLEVANGSTGDLVRIVVKTNTATRQSEASSIASIVLPGVKPNPPSNLTLSNV